MTEPVDSSDGSIGHMLENTAKLIRVGSMIGSMLAEVRAAPMDEEGLQVVREIYELAVAELGDNLDEDTLSELRRLTVHLDSGTPTQSELRVVQAQLVGWLEGMFQGIQLALVSSRLAEQQNSASLEDRTREAGSGEVGQYL